MSGYQYYEFQAIDRPLTTKEQAAIQKLSSRVKPTPHRALYSGRVTRYFALGRAQGRGRGNLGALHCPVGSLVQAPINDND